MIFSSNPHDLIHCISLTCTLIGHRCNHQHHLNIKLHLYLIGLAGPVGFDPTTTGSGGLRFFLKKQHPVLTRRRALSGCLSILIYETYRPTDSASCATFSLPTLSDVIVGRLVLLNYLICFLLLIHIPCMTKQ
jgi:hypothetical protein